jgi:N-acetylmuramate 1-kinase
MDFFAKHFIEAYRGVVIAPAAKEALREELLLIIEELASEERVLCHRDYHSRNLMLHDERLYIIDFQDARMGPDTYDLASLLRDSYVDLPDPTINELIAYFLALKGTTDPMQETVFRERLDLMALQRNLKALGTFGYQTTARRNPVYIQYIPRTLRYVRDNVGRHPRFSRLRDVLAAHVEEFR